MIEKVVAIFNKRGDRYYKIKIKAGVIVSMEPAERQHWLDYVAHVVLNDPPTLRA